MTDCPGRREIGALFVDADGGAFPRSVLDNRRAAWFHERAVARCALREHAGHLSHTGRTLGTAGSGRVASTMESLQGQLLIASSSLVDPNFARTVVLIAVHGEDGALGLILNRELGTTLQEVWQQVSKSSCVREENVQHGGPVTGTLMALHDRRSLANLVVADEVYVATELGAMESLAASEEGRVFFYMGHAGLGGRPARERARRGLLARPPRDRRPRLQRPRPRRALESGHDGRRPPPGPVRLHGQACPRGSQGELKSYRLVPAAGLPDPRPGRGGFSMSIRPCRFRIIIPTLLVASLFPHVASPPRQGRFCFAAR